MHKIKTVAELEAIYNAAPSTASTAKVASRITAEYRTLIEHSPFVTLATSGSEGLDCSPRGDEGQVVHILDEHTLALPDRRGNNRIDSLRNIIENPKVALLFLLPGSGTTFRVNGTATLTDDLALCQTFEKEGKLPRCIIIIKIEALYFQCARAVIRAGLWDATRHIPADQLPTPGQILERMTKGKIDAKHYDTDWPTRAKQTMW